jgi:glycerol-3-phosphate dehydrogenase (NAD(P)+)
MGTAVAWPLRDNGHEVRLVGTHLDAEIIQSCKENRYHPTLKRQIPDGVTPYFVEDMGPAVDGADLVVSGVNSLGVNWIGQTLGAHLKPGQTILAVTKGLEADADGNLRILPDVLAASLPDTIRDRVKHAAIGGPCIAGELAGQRQTCVIFGCRDGDTARSLAGLFRTGYYHVWATADLVGLEVGVALKNAYVLAVGMAAGFLERAGGVDSAGAHMFNLAACSFAQGATEIEQMLGVMGATRAFAHGLPGVGDMYVTAAGGRTVRAGRLLGLGHTFAEARQIMAGETLESVEIVRSMGKAIPRLVQDGKIGPDDLPLMRMLVDVVVHGKPAQPPLESYFNNTPGLMW